jgi:signal transduction histidine kinase
MLTILRTIQYHNELIERLLKARGGTFATGIIAPVVICFILKDSIDTKWLMTWMVAAVSLFFIRTTIASTCLKILHTHQQHTINTLLKYYLVTIFLNATLFGVIYHAAILYADELQVLILSAFLSTIIAGAMATLSPVFHAVFIFIFTSLSLFASSLLIAGESTTYYTLALLVIFYMIITLTASLNIFRSLNSAMEQKEHLKSKNRNFQKLLDVLMESVVIYDKEKKIIDINESGLKLLKIDDAKSVIGKEITEFIPEYELKKVYASLKMEHSGPYEIDLRKNGGEIFPALFSGHDVVLDDKELRIGTIMDITPLKQKDQLLFQQSRQAAMGEMIGNIAHQWRQPLNTLSLIMQNIYYSYKDELLTTEQLEHSTQKGQAIMENMSKTIDDFRNFFSTQKVPHLFSISESIHSAVELIAASYQQNNIALEFDLDESAQLLGHSNEFAQVILNLLSNAKDAFMQRQSSPAVVTIKSYQDNGTIIVTVEDNAGGIADDIINKVFEPYFTTKHKDVGTGIGLYMSKMIIKNMEGQIQVENYNSGALFRITLPLTKE